MKIITLLYVFFTLTPVFAQTDKFNSTQNDVSEARHEVGLNFFSIQNLDWNPIQEKLTARYNYPSGILYKRNSNDNVLRAGFDYYFKKLNEEVSGEMYYSKDDGVSHACEFRIGYERIFGKGRLRPFIGSDLVFNSRRDHGARGGVGDFNTVFSESPYDNRIKRIGLAPVFGLKLHLSEAFSINIELNANANYYLKKQLVISKSNSGFELFFNPLRVCSLNYQF